jgi:hypothetical protein
MTCVRNITTFPFHEEKKKWRFVFYFVVWTCDISLTFVIVIGDTNSKTIPSSSFLSQQNATWDFKKFFFQKLKLKKFFRKKLNSTPCKTWKFSKFFKISCLNTQNVLSWSEDNIIDITLKSETLHFLLFSPSQNWLHFPTESSEKAKCCENVFYFSFSHPAKAKHHNCF